MTVIDQIPRPSWATGIWTWPWPPANTLLGAQANAWLGTTASAAVAWAQRSAIEWWEGTALAHELEALPDGVLEGLYGVATLPMRIGAVSGSRELAAVILDTLGDSLDLVRTITTATSAAQGIPILGWVASIVQAGATVAAEILREGAPIMHAPTTYDPDAASYYQALVLDYSTRAPERAFYPWGWGDVISVRVQGGGREWVQAERGDGMGYVPFAGLIGWSIPGQILALWRVDTDRPVRDYYEPTRPWVQRRWVQPGTVEALDTLWRRCNDSPGIFDISPDAIVQEWDKWERQWLTMRAMKTEPGTVARRWAAISLPLQTSQRQVTAYDGQIYTAATPLMAWMDQAERLKKRQRALLRTLAGVAYTSETQRAFQRDPELRATLLRNRIALLHDDAVHDVQVGAVADLDYREAVKMAQRRRKLGPTKLAGIKPKVASIWDKTVTLP